MLTNIFWRLLILETLVIGVLSTNGLDEHLQKKFCNSEYVFQGERPKKRNYTGPYILEPTVTFKGDFNKLNYRTKYIKLNTHSFLDSLAGRVFIIFGKNRNGTIKSELCRGIFPKNWLSSFQIIALRTHYQTGCDCIRAIGRFNRAKFCKWKLSYMVKYEGKCTWMGSTPLEKCENTTLGSSETYKIYM